MPRRGSRILDGVTLPYQAAYEPTDSWFRGAGLRERHRKVDDATRAHMLPYVIDAKQRGSVPCPERISAPHSLKNGEKYELTETRFVPHYPGVLAQLVSR